MRRDGGWVERNLSAKQPARAIRVAVLAVLLLTTGCASLRDLSLARWAADYDTAEARAEAADRDLLIFYEGSRLGSDRQMWKALNSRDIRRQTGSLVRCALVPSYEPDRRYVGQYGVERAPALILVRRDGTYHAEVGAMSAPDIAQFLADADTPGAMPILNPYIPHRVEYDWYGSLTKAEAVAARTNKPILVVFYRHLTRDWAGISELLDARDVHRRFQDMVHCQSGRFRPWTKAYITQFGAIKLPALVLIEPDRTYHVLELPTSCESIIRFADGVKYGTAEPAGPSAEAATP